MEPIRLLPSPHSSCFVPSWTGGLAFLEAVIAVIAVASCNQLAGIERGALGEGPWLACDRDADCAAHATACSTANGCRNGFCAMVPVAEGTRADETWQTPGDCLEITCDGAGQPEIVLASDDVPDDDNPCTRDACEDGSPVHHAGVDTAPCYEGPEGTRGVGSCHDGFQACDANGEPVGPCIGQRLPGAPDCTTASDNNCDKLGQLGLGDTDDRGDEPGEMGAALPRVLLVEPRP